MDYGDFYSRPPLAKSADRRDYRLMQHARESVRGIAMGIILEWAGRRDFTPGAMDALIYGDARILESVGPDDDELLLADEGEEELYESIRNQVAGAMVKRFKAKEEVVRSFFEDGNLEAGARLGVILASALDDDELTDAEIIADYEFDEDEMGADYDEEDGECVYESMVKVVRDGQIVLKKKRRKKYRMTAEQRAALREARRKSHTAAAELGRTKAMRMRKARGM